ncbi:MAG: hypothetical protein NZ530_04080 [Thermodesulfobacteriaceae bacterium]|nr:hypothetical protein [Thermodesulfobacteriaceae bacterium]MCX8042092.1 hypothetical protein [Thermodesulfobacteriaceae bacterium]MDW8136480.1 hypothetical protein [Thermodesulfobacterium sp.]
MKKFIFYVLLLCFILFKYFGLGFSETGLRKVLILPFEIYAQQDLGYLKSAIPEMLTSRLFSASKIEVIEIEKVKPLLKEVKTLDKVKVEELGNTFKADYVIWGSLTALGDTVSIDAQIIDLSKSKKPAQFYQEIKGLSEVIPQISRFAKKAKSYIEGKEEDFYKEEVVSFHPTLSLSRAHPERNLYPERYYSYPRGTSPGNVPLQEQKPKVTRAKPRFSYDEEESLTKNLVIDLSKERPIIGWAEEKASINATSTPLPSPSTTPIYSAYPNYPVYYYPIQEEKGFLERVWDSIWPFKKKESSFSPYYYQPPTIQPLPPVQASQPLQNLQTPRTQVPVQVPSQPPSIYNLPPKSPISGGSGENPWQWN